jgi:succinate-semialdehyde dehydrogenase/glutarate-semialdehyde dehydrogenase
LIEIRPFIAGDYEDGDGIAPVEDKYTGATAARVHIASRPQVDRAVDEVARAQERLRDSLPPYRRYEILTEAARLLAERSRAFTDAIMLDTGFPAADASKEVERAQQTLLLSGEEAKRITGEMVPIDAAPGGSRRLAFTLRRPVGVVCAITPFNSPLNTVLHKVAPAFAAGNGVVLKPSLYTPVTADLMLRLLLDAGVPAELISVLHGEGAKVGQWLLEHQVPGFYAFTGSTAVGLRIRETIGVRRAQLELGSLSSTIVCSDANIERAAALCVNAAFRKAGQVCTSVQRLYVHEAVAADFSAALAAELAPRLAGDPSDARTFVGPVISKDDAERIESWVDDAVSGGAKVAYGGGRDGRVVKPVVLTDVTPAMKVMSTEVFGPVVSLRPFTVLEQAIAEVNGTPYGLSAGVFTSDIGNALAAADLLRFGTVHINETSSARVDLLPFGGVKASGEGREGPAYAIAEMTEERLVTIGAA